ncbi:hypothetical protein F5Y16DRAFT_392312 [Xylariaceae sp. FL0255]|nr:hypothetical protein F5Y16DRAFT_392312 [Xylariaceae sp. FL0255]
MRLLKYWGDLLDIKVPISFLSASTMAKHQVPHNASAADKHGGVPQSTPPEPPPALRPSSLHPRSRARKAKTEETSKPFLPTGETAPGHDKIYDTRGGDSPPNSAPTFPVWPGVQVDSRSRPMGTMTDTSLLPPTVSAPTLVQNNRGGKRGRGPRATRACKTCRRLRVKCDEKHPCGTCLLKRLKCVYEQNGKHRRHGVKDVLWETYQTVLKIEARHIPTHSEKICPCPSRVLSTPTQTSAEVVPCSLDGFFDDESEMSAMLGSYPDSSPKKQEFTTPSPSFACTSLLAGPGEDEKELRQAAGREDNWDPEKIEHYVQNYDKDEACCGLLRRGQLNEMIPWVFRSDEVASSPVGPVAAIQEAISLLAIALGKLVTQKPSSPSPGLAYFNLGRHLFHRIRPCDDELSLVSASVLIGLYLYRTAAQPKDLLEGLYYCQSATLRIKSYFNQRVKRSDDMFIDLHDICLIYSACLHIENHIILHCLTALG